MDKLEKVFTAYEICSNPSKDCIEDGCPYENICYHDHFCNTAAKNAVQLLIEFKAENNRLKQKQQPKTGHWEVLTMCANEGTYCSECHTKIFDFVHPPKKKLSQFCPHCGAKMEDAT